MNKAVFVGNLTRDAELKHSNTGTAIVNFDVAVNDREKKGEEWVDYPSYLKCVMFGKRAESVHKYLAKGQRVGITARIRQDRWEQDGTKRSAVKFMVDDIDLLGEKRERSEQPAYGTQPGDMGYQGGNADEFSDDVPF